MTVARRPAAAGASDRTLSFTSGGHQLEGTLRLPSGTGPFAAVLLLTGSGPIDRDSNHKRLRFDVTRQLADALARAGVASYRYDKRGVGASPGDWREAGLFDNVQDAGAALTMLRGLPEIDADTVFVAGHSEGAIQAVALAATSEHRLAGLVLLAPSARTGEEMLRWQARVIAPTLPAPVRLLLRLLRVDVVKKVSANHAKLKATTTDVARLGLAKVNAKWFREYLAYDPGTDLAALTVPVLGLTGSSDLQVDPADLDVLQRRVPAEVETHRVPGLTHTLRRVTGRASLSRYKQEIRRPVDPFVLDTVVDWVQRHR